MAGILSGVLKQQTELQRIMPISHARNWLSIIPSPALGLHMLDREFPAFACWDCPCQKRAASVLSALIPLGTIRSGVAVMEIGFSDMTFSVMQKRGPEPIQKVGQKNRILSLIYGLG